MDPFTFISGVLLGASGVWAARRGLDTLAQAPQPGLGDLLGWAFLIADGVILMKDGSFLAGMVVRGRDLESATTQEVDQAARSVPRCDRSAPSGV